MLIFQMSISIDYEGSEEKWNSKAMSCECWINTK